jgi:hypothetical protein
LVRVQSKKKKEERFENQLKAEVTKELGALRLKQAFVVRAGLHPQVGLLPNV